MSRRRSLQETAAAEGAIETQAAIAALEREGYVVHKPEPPRTPTKFDPGRIRGRKRVRIWVPSDSHFGSKFQQPTYLREHFRYARRRGIDAVLWAGDITDGSPSMHPGFVYETWAHGADAQVDAAVEAIPGAAGLDQFVIGGNHDASHYKAAGFDVVRAICAKRDDLHYLGPEQASRNFAGSVGWVEFGQVLVQLCHPHMGSTRTRSYRLETWIENISPPRPHIVFMGNFHKPVEINFRNTWGVMLPAYQSQSAWMASKGIASVVGSCIVEFGMDTRGVAPSMSIEWLMEYESRPGDYPGGRRR